jgi:hypothetical protein
MLEAFVDAPLSHQNLTVFPVIAPNGPVLPYLLSTELGETGVLTIRERGNTQDLMVLAKNESLHPLLVLAGEPLPGEDPGRLVSRSFILGGKSVTQIPVASMKEGRWTNPEEESVITRWVERFPHRKDQIGILACVGNQIVGMESLGSANLYRLVHRRFLVRFIREALCADKGVQQDLARLETAASSLVENLEVADRLDTKRVGLGDYWELKGPVVGGELFHQGHLVHLSVFRVSAGYPTPVGKEG